jgi:integrase
MRERLVAVYRRLGDPERVASSRRALPAVQLDVLVSDFLRAFAAGELPGRTPAPATLDLYTVQFLGNRGGLLTFARATGRTSSVDLDDVLVTRWMEGERSRLSPDSLRLKLVAARRLADFGHGRGYVRDEAHAAIRRLRPPPSAKGRARVDGVPTRDEVARLVSALRPDYWARIAEVQWRLGLRRGEVLALRPDWVDSRLRAVVVRARGDFTPKDIEPRTIDNVDAATLALASELAEWLVVHRPKATAYRDALRRAMGRLAKEGHPWLYKHKSHALRASYAVQSRLAGVPLTVVRDRLGHASERTTERYYLGRVVTASPSPFEDQPLVTYARPQVGAQVIPFRRRIPR